MISRIQFLMIIHIYANINVPLQKAFDLGLLEQKGNIRATEKGFDFLNDMQQIFL
jgi:predicted transcriptional regulator